MLTLAICNMAILGLIVAGIHRLIRDATDAATATTASMVIPTAVWFLSIH